MSQLQAVCKRCGKNHTFNAENCKPHAKATYPNGQVKEWVIDCDPMKAVFICDCGTFGVAKEATR